jgi:hypothetical protein
MVKITIALYLKPPGRGIFFSAFIDYLALFRNDCRNARNLIKQKAPRGREGLKPK